MPDYAADIAVKVKLDKQDIAKEFADQLRLAKKEADGEYITYKVRGDLSSLKDALQDLSKKNIQIGTDIRIETDQKDLQNQLKHVESFVGQSASKISKRLQTDIAKQLDSTRVTSSYLLKLFTGDPKSRTTQKSLINMVEGVTKEMNSAINGDFGNKTILQLEESLKLYSGIYKLIDDINVALDGTSTQIDASKFATDLMKVYTSAGKYISGSQGNVISSSITSLEKDIQDANAAIQPMINELLSLFGDNTGASSESVMSSKIQKVQEELKTAREELGKLESSANKSPVPESFKKQISDAGNGVLKTFIRNLASGSKDKETIAKLQYAVDEYNKRGLTERGSFKYGTAIDVDSILAENAAIQDGNGELEKQRQIVENLERQLEELGNVSTNADQHVVPEQDIQKLQSELTELSHDYEDALNKVSELQKKIDEKTSTSDELEKTKNDLADIKKELEEVKKNAESAKNTLNRIGTESVTPDQIQAIVNSEAQALRLLEIRNKELAEKEKELQDANDKINDNEKEITRLKNENIELQRESDKLRDNIEKRSDAYDKAKANISKYSFDPYEQALKQIDQSNGGLIIEHWDKAATYYGIYVDSVKENGEEAQRIIVGEIDYTEQLINRYKELKDLSQNTPQETIRELNNINKKIVENNDNINRLSKENKLLKDKKKQEEEISKISEKIVKNQNETKPVTKETQTKTTKQVYRKGQGWTNVDEKESGGVSREVEILPKIDIEKWNSILQDAIKKLDLSVDLKFHMSNKLEDIQLAQRKLAAYNRTITNNIEGIVSQKDIDLATRAKQELLDIYPELEKYENTTKEELISVAEVDRVNQLSEAVKLVTEAVNDKINSFKTEQETVSDVTEKEVKSLESLLEILKKITEQVDAKSTAFTQEKLSVDNAITFEKNKIDDLNKLLEKVRNNVEAISKLKIQINQVQDTAGQVGSDNNQKKKSKRNNHSKSITNATNAKIAEIEQAGQVVVEYRKFFDDAGNLTRTLVKSRQTLENGTVNDHHYSIKYNDKNKKVTTSEIDSENYNKLLIEKERAEKEKEEAVAAYERYLEKEREKEVKARADEIKKQKESHVKKQNELEKLMRFDLIKQQQSNIDELYASRKRYFEIDNKLKFVDENDSDEYIDDLKRQRDNANQEYLRLLSSLQEILPDDNSKWEIINDELSRITVEARSDVIKLRNKIDKASKNRDQKETEKQTKKQADDAFANMAKSLERYYTIESDLENNRGKYSKEYINYLESELDKSYENYISNKRIVELNSDIISQEKVKIKEQEILNEAVEKEQKLRQKDYELEVKARADETKKQARETEKQTKKQADDIDTYRANIKKYGDKINNVSFYRNGDSPTKQYLDEVERVKSLYEEYNKIDLENNFSTENLERANDIITKITDKLAKINLMRGDANFILADRVKFGQDIANLEKFLGKNTAMPKELRAQYDELLTRMRQAFSADDFVTTEAQAKGLREEIGKLNAEFYQVGKTGRNMFDRIKASIKSQTAQFIAYYLSIQDLIRYLRQAFDYVLQIDTAITELRKVSDASTERLNQSFEKSARTAQELGSSITDVINITADYARLGYAVDEAEELARVTTLFKTVGDNMSADDASSYLISTMQGFQISADKAIDIVDKYNEVECCLHLQ